MLKIKNMDEKILIIAGYFIRQRDRGKGFGDKDIFMIWTKYFPGDFNLRKKRYKYQRFIFADEKTKYGDLMLSDQRWIHRYIIDNYNKLWDSCCKSVNDYIKGHSNDDWEKDIVALRKRHERHLKIKCTILDGKAEIKNWPINRLSTYYIYINKSEFIGNYERCIESVERTKKEKRLKERFK